MEPVLNEDGLVIGAEDTIYTYSGTLVTPLRPDPEQIKLADISHALAHQCRFTGHTSKFYSVAEHSVLASKLITENKELSLWALLHDASEAYLSDLARPIKKAEGLGPVYLKAEEKLMWAIAKRFGLEWPMPSAINEVDTIMLQREIHQLMPQSLRDSWEVPVGYAKLPCWSPIEAKASFRWRFEELTNV